MISNEKIINRICKRIDHDLGDGSTAARLKIFEDAILEQTLHPPRRTDGGHRKMLLIAAVIVSLIVPAIIVAAFLHETPLQLKVDGHRVNRSSQMTLQTAKNGTRKIQFANNSSINLMSGTVATVQKATDDEVVVALARGELFLDVEGKESKTWIVHMGEYQVSVLGTRFHVKWYKENALLDVRVKNGAVLVEGPYTGKVGIAVHRDTHLRLDTQTGFSAMNNMHSAFYDANSPSLLRNEHEVQVAWHTRMGIPNHVHLANADKSKTETVEDAKPQSVHDDKLRGRRDNATRRHSNRGNGAQHKKVKNSVRSDLNHSYAADESIDKKDTNWKPMLNTGDFQGAITAAEYAGFSKVIEKATLEQLWQLMNAARKSGRDELAEQTLLTCRRRFASSRKARLAAFVLGKVHYYGMNDASRAAQWFETYLTETPAGPLAEEAMGRLIAIQAERGQTAEARSLAQKYLQRYPTGAFSKTCHELISD